MPNSTTSLPIGAPVPDPTPRKRPPHTVLGGKAVTLEPLDLERHGAGLQRASHGSTEREQVWRYMPAGPFPSEDALCSWYELTLAPGDPLFYAVVDPLSSNPIGVVSYLNIETTHGAVEIGHIWYTPDVQRSNVNTESCYLLLRHAFDDLGYRRVEWKCDSLNARSRVAALRLGFQFEGIFRQHRIVGGLNRDTAWFSITDSEWPVLRSAMERWLEWQADAQPRPSLSTLTAR
ncbi:MAG: RimJ/RimL family protein N-acetyltransferase [Chlamydiales bacterium]|jgi:RimJ/RimL family protein N-acetyltransferase